MWKNSEQLNWTDSSFLVSLRGLVAFVAHDGWSDSMQSNAPSLRRFKDQRRFWVFTTHITYAFEEMDEELDG